MPSCHFVHLILLSSGPKVPKSGPFKNEGIHEMVRLSHKRFSASWFTIAPVLAGTHKIVAMSIPHGYTSLHI
jgi:hypothetical protein